MQIAGLIRDDGQSTLFKTTSSDSEDGEDELEQRARFRGVLDKFEVVVAAVVVVDENKHDGGGSDGGGGGGENKHDGGGSDGDGDDVLQTFRYQWSSAVTGRFPIAIIVKEPLREYSSLEEARQENLRHFFGIQKLKKEILKAAEDRKQEVARCTPLPPVLVLLVSQYDEHLTRSEV